MRSRHEPNVSVLPHVRTYRSADARSAFAFLDPAGHAHSGFCQTLALPPLRQPQRAGDPEAAASERHAADAASILRPGGLFAIVNWPALPREETTVLGEPRGPATEVRMSPQAVNAAVQQGAFRLVHIVEIPPYHYGSIFAANSN